MRIRFRWIPTLRVLLWLCIAAGLANGPRIVSAFSQIQHDEPLTMQSPAKIWSLPSNHRLFGPQALLDTKVKRQVSDPIMPSGKVGGSITCIAKQGNHLFMGYGARMVILDISLITTIGPQVVSSTLILPGVIKNIVVAGNYAYLSTQQAGLRIWDVSNRAAPFEVGSFDSREHVMYVQVQGDHAYLVGDYNYFTILNISNPANPVEMSTTYIDGTTFRLAVSGSHVYLANGDRLIVMDTTDKSAPVQIGQVALPGTSVDDVIVEDQMAYVQDGMAGLWTVDTSNPISPTVIGTFSTSWTGDGITKSGNYIYASVWTEGVWVIDVSDPAYPVQVTSLNPGGHSIDTVVDDNFAYVACELLGLCVLDISTPSTLFYYGLFPFRPTGSVNGLSLQGPYVYIAKSWNGLGIIDVSVPQLAQEIGSFTAFEGQYFAASALDVEVQQDYAYIREEHGLRIVNVTNPQQPTQAGYLPVEGFISKLAVQDDVAFLLNSQAPRLEIIDVSDVVSPTLLSSYGISQAASDLAVQGDYAFFIDGIGLHILDVSDKTRPVETGIFTETNYYNLTVVGDYAYVIRLDELRIIDITDKAHPVGVSLFPMPKSQSGIVVTGDLVYTTGFYSFCIFDVSNKQKPFLVREGLLPSVSAYVFAVTNEYAFFANGEAGMVVVPLSDALTPTVHFSTSSYSTSESIGVAAITVTLSSPSVYTVTADYATHIGTAVAGSDYITTSGTLTFTPGITLTNFTVPILDDALDEDNETVMLVLSNPVNATLLTPESATLIILDNDGQFCICLPLALRDVGLLVYSKR